MPNIQRPSLDELEEYLKNAELEESRLQREAEQRREAELRTEELLKALLAQSAAAQNTAPSPAPAPAPTVSAPAEAAPVQETAPVAEPKHEAKRAKAKKAKQPKAKKSPLMAVWGVLSTVLVIAVMVLAIALVGVRVIGFTPYAVLSPSMTPTYAPGDLIYVKETPTDEINEGDVITFVADEKNTIVTHRVVEVDRDGRKFYTQGDANDSRDGNPVLYENVVGVVQFSVPKLGYVSSYVTSETGRYVAIAGIFVLILLWILPELFRPEEKKTENE